VRRRLIILNVALFAATAVGLWRFRSDYRQAQERYGVLRLAAPAPAPAPKPASPAPPVQPGSFLDAAAKYLFSPDRNPTVVVEAPKVKPRPELPVLYGVLDVGGGPIALLAAKPNERHKPVRVGESIGDFKLLAAASDQITLEWEGEKIEAAVAELRPRLAPEAPAAGGAAAAASAGGGAAAPGPASKNATVLSPNISGRPGEYLIGAPMQGAAGTIYASPPGDTAPHGTVHQGKRKVVRQTPFGQQSWWEDVQ
jgi:hypothetical protein